MRIFIGGTGPVIDFLVTHLSFLGFATSQGFIAFSKKKIVEPQDIKGQLLLKEEDLGKPLWEVIRERVHDEVSADIKIIGVDDLDSHSYDAVVAAASVDTDIDVASELPSNEKPIWAICTKTAAFVGNKRPIYEKSEFDVLTPSLAAVAAGFAITEIMRRNLLIRPSEILSRDMTLQCVIQQRGILEKCKEAEKNRKGLPFRIRLKIGGEVLASGYEEFTEEVRRYVGGKLEESVRVDPDRVILTCTFPGESYLSRMLFEQVEILDNIPDDMFVPVDRLLFSPLAETHLEENGGELRVVDKDVHVPTEIVGKNVYFLGVGGIGTWSTALFNLSNTKDCTLILNDHDSQVEEHNLNRQILFTRESIGKPKAFAARKKLLEINPDNHVVSLPWQTEIGTINSIHMKDTISLDEYNNRQNESKVQIIDGIEIPADIVSEESVLAHELSRSHMLICGPDNIRTRYISTVIGKMLNIPVINAGAERFEGKVDLFEPDGDCYVCRYGEDTKEQREVVSCTGQIPVPSIVSTIGTIGAMQTAIAMARLANIDSEITHFLQYYPRFQMLAKCEAGRGCHHKMKGNCPEHLNLPPEDNLFTFFPPKIKKPD
jgi:molybdopterin/thiamine biosynthesis adenylyltransferase